MKGKIFTLLAVTGLLALTSCNEAEEIATIPEDVEFTVSFGFAESGSMSRSGATVYEEFYNNYITTKELTPDTYTLTFKQNDKTITDVNGSWGSADIITLPAGTYTVTGTSGSAECYSEKALLTFNQDVEITSNTTNINLTADYNCLLIMLDGTEIKSPYYYHYSGNTITSTYLFAKDDIYYIFLSNSPSSNNATEYIRYYAAGQSQSDYSYLYIDQLNLEIGNYYYYDFATGSFDIPPMTAGN